MTTNELQYGPTTKNCLNVSRAIRPEILEFSIGKIKKYLQKSESDHESETLHTSLEWLNYNRKERTKHLLDLMQNIELSNYSIGYLEFMMRKYEGLLDSRPILYKWLAMDLLQRAIPGKSRAEDTGFAIILDQDHCFWHWQGIPADDKSEEKSLVDKSQEIGVDSCSSIDFNKLCRISEHVEELQDYALCASFDGFALTGGNGSKLCVQYNIHKHRWEELPCLLSQRKFHSAFFVRNYRNTSAKLFVLGGVVDRSKEALRSVESLEAYDTEWLEESSMPRPVIGASVAQLDNRIFVMAPEVLHSLDLTTSTWTEAPEVTERLSIDGTCTLSMAAAGSVLYFIKGTSFSSYDPSSGNWTELKPHMLSDVCGPLLAYQHKLYVLGAKDDDTVVEHNIETLEWGRSKFKLPSPLDTRKIKYIQATPISVNV